MRQSELIALFEPANTALGTMLAQRSASGERSILGEHIVDGNVNDFAELDILGIILEDIWLIGNGALFSLQGTREAIDKRIFSAEF